MRSNKIEKAFALFSEEAARLEKSYTSLREDFIKIQERLSDSYRTLSSIVAHLENGLLCISEEGIITVFNESAARLTSLNTKEIIGGSYESFFPDNLFGFSMKEALTKKISPKHLSITFSSDGVERELEITTSHLERIGLLVLINDVTEIKAFRKASLQNDRLKEIGEMAATLAHEIRNPLGGIEGFATLMLRDLKQSPKLAAMASSIAVGTRHLNHLVTSILLYAKPLELNFKHQNLSLFLEDVIKLFPKKITFHQSKTPSFASFDGNEMKRALLNLIQNALDAAKKKVVITLKTTSKEIFISIQDDGEGILEEHLPKIFTPFFTTKTKGTGLGLSESYKIIKAHGGEIQVMTKKNKGTTFTIQLEKDT